jgi:hypothetical protein
MFFLDLGFKTDSKIHHISSGVNKTTQRPTTPTLSIHTNSDNLLSAPTKRCIDMLNGTTNTAWLDISAAPTSHLLEATTIKHAFQIS